jgi:hypothetical protein
MNTGRHHTARAALFALAAALFPALSGQAQTEPPEHLKITALTPPYLELMPGPHYWARMRTWQGIPGITVAPGGRLWAIWYTGLLDEGKTWPFKLVLDERESVSYPDGAEGKAGVVYVIYDRGRYKKDMQEILLARITEADNK